MILRELAAALGCAVRGDDGIEVRRVAGIDDAGPGDLTFIANPRYAARLPQSRASAVIVSPDVETSCPAVLSRNPYLAYARAVALLHPEPRPAPGVHPSAVVDPTAVVGPDVHVGPLCVVGARTRIGARSELKAQVVIGPDVTVGEDCLFHSGAQIREGCRLGNRVILQNGAVIGADGFGFAKDEEGRYHKIPQRGIVVIEDDVEIGALSAVDRAALAETRIGRGVKIDNLVQVGHSVSIGSDSVMAGQVGIAGSTKIGSKVTLAGQVGVAGHLSIGDGVVATAQTGIPNSVDPGKVLSGSPAIDNRDWLKSSAVFSRLPEILKRVRDLEREVLDLKKPSGTS
jgi:UDP-3-O-[3-hydroxymyristoyl] glucosamine N-acyltransferase